MPDEEDITKPIMRESIRSVKEEDRHRFSIYFTTLFLVGMGFCAWYEIFYVTNDSTFDTIVALSRDVGISGIASVTLSFVRFEGGDAMGIALDLFRKQKYAEKYAEGYSEWEGWFERYKDAQENGIPFDESQPRNKNGNVIAAGASTSSV